MQGSDLVAQATIPANAPHRRTNSWQDNASLMSGAMSWADHSLVGGGITENGSVISARSMYSAQMRNETDSLMEQLMRDSRSRQVPVNYPQGLYNRQSPAQSSSGGASVASMSIASAGLASLGSVKSIMSDLSSNLIALDLAEPNIPDHHQQQQQPHY